MFDATSRYAKLRTLTLTATGPDGQSRNVRYVERRFLPAAGEGTPFVEHSLAQGERLDHLAGKYLGDPTLFWRVCDANEVLGPNELTEEVGRTVRIEVPGI